MHSCVVRLFALIVLSLGLHVPAAASEVKLCNKGTVPVGGLYLSEVYSFLGSEWDINAWETIAPGKCASVWSGAASVSYVVIHVVLALVNHQGDVGIVKYNFNLRDEPQITESMRRKGREAICGKYGLMQDRGGSFRPTQSSLDTYKGTCSAPYEALPVSAGVVLSGSNVYLTLNVESSEDDYGRIIKVIGKSKPAPMLSKSKESFQAGANLLGKQEFAGAVELFSQSIREAQNPRAYVGRAMAYYFTGKFKEAFADAEVARSTADSFRTRSLALEALAHTYAALGSIDQKKAIDFYWNAYVSGQGLPRDEQRPNDKWLADVFETAGKRCGLERTLRDRALFFEEALAKKCALVDPATIRLP